MNLVPLTPLVHACAVAFGLLLVALLWFDRRGARAANRWLAAYVMTLTGLSLGDLLQDTRWVLQWPHLAHLTDWSIFLLGPILWMYVRRLTRQGTPGIGVWLWHAVPALIVLLLLVPFYVLPAERKQVLIAQELSSPATSPDPVLLIAAVQLLAYWLAGLVTLRRYRRSLRDHFSELEKRSFHWLAVMLAVNLGMWLLWIVSLLGRSPSTYWLDVVAIPAGMYLLAFFAVRQPDVFVDLRADHPEQLNLSLPAEVVPEPVAAAPMPLISPDRPRYERSGLDRSQLPLLQDRLEALMRTEKPWLEGDLSLAQLATSLSVPPHHLSQLLNEHMGQTFFDYINRRRVQEVQRCLRDEAYAGQSILAIALESGFNSKAAFNATFRQYTGTTPSAFRRSTRHAD